MATSPDRVRLALKRVTEQAQAEVRVVTRAAGSDPALWRASMFEAMPLVVSEYGPASAALALDWFEEIREDSAVRTPFAPTPKLNITDDDVSAAVASITRSLADFEQQVATDAAQLISEASKALEAEAQKQVASGFWDTITVNSDADPAAVGWQRYARGGACKFCVMLAGRGAVYTRATVNFAAHTTCHCVAGPSYDQHAPKASVMQYLGSKRDRTEQERADLRAYLTENYPDSPG